jgi:microcystin-dependent protein
MDEFIGVIKMFAGNFAPRNFAFCEGQLLPINQNQALFSILGTTYGGDGRVTFALPDLRGRTPIGTGNGPGLSSIRLGQIGGLESLSLNVGNMPSHTHSLGVSSDPGTTNNPSGSLLAQSNVTIERGSAPIPAQSFNGTPNATMAASSIGASGGSQPVQLRNPYMATNYIICLFGVFPSRN